MVRHLCVSLGKLGFKGIARSKISYSFFFFLSKVTHPHVFFANFFMFFKDFFFFMWNMTGDIWYNVDAALFHKLKVNGDRCCKALKKLIMT